MWIFCFCKHLYWIYFDFTSNYYNCIFIFELIVKIALCKKPYPDLIHKNSEKMLLLTDKKYPRSLCLLKILRIQPVTRVDSDLSSYDMFEWPEEHKCMRLTAKNVIIDAALDQGKSSWRSSSSSFLKSFLKSTKTQCYLWKFKF